MKISWHLWTVHDRKESNYRRILRLSKVHRAGISNFVFNKGSSMNDVTLILTFWPPLGTEVLLLSKNHWSPTPTSLTSPVEDRYRTCVIILNGSQTSDPRTFLKKKISHFTLYFNYGPHFILRFMRPTLLSLRPLL